MVTTNTDGNWKRVTGTADEVIAEMNTDNVKNTDMVALTHDGTNFVAVYWDGAV